MKSKILGLLAVALLARPMGAMAIPTLIGSAANATGVTGLVVGTNVYNVTFLAQAYNAVYPGNDAPFLGNNQGALDARDELLSFLNGSSVSGMLGFDCLSNQCNLVIPDVSYPSSNSASGPSAILAPWFYGNTNWQPNYSGFPASCVGVVTGSPCYNPERTGLFALGHFALAPSVPEPGTLALLGLGLAGLGLTQRRKAA